MARFRKIPSPFTALSVVVEGLLQTQSLESKYREYSLQKRWDTIVGELISRHTNPDTVRFGRLHVLVDSPAWLQQLTFLKPQLLRKIEAHLGKTGIVKDIVLRLGNHAVRDSKTSPRGTPRNEPDENTRCHDTTRTMP